MIVATTSGLLPTRLDLTHIAAAYGAGSIVGEAIASRRGMLGADDSMRRWGSLFTAMAAIAWCAGMLGALD